MKNTLLFTIIATMLFSCKKDNIPLPNVWKGPQTHGYAKAKRNGQDWEGSAGWTYTIGDSSRIQLLVETLDIVDLDTASIELLVVTNILTDVDDYLMNDFEEAKIMRLPFASYGIGFADEIDAHWVNNNKFSNVLTIESFDPITTLIRGRFSLTLKKVDDYTESKEGFPSKVTFEDGTFEARYIPPPQ